MMRAKRRGRLKRLFLAAVCAVGLAWTAACSVIYYNMRRPPEEFGHFMTRIPAPVAFLGFPFETLWTSARSGTLNAGDAAPDFTLLKFDHSGSVRLSELDRERPVVLIFGSYT
jgi:hypothetical protein